jgi:hypothetical protein
LDTAASLGRAEMVGEFSASLLAWLAVGELGAGLVLNVALELAVGVVLDVAAAVGVALALVA